MQQLLLFDDRFDDQHFSFLFLFPSWDGLYAASYEYFGAISRIFSVVFASLDFVSPSLSCYDYTPISLSQEFILPFSLPAGTQVATDFAYRPPWGLQPYLCREGRSTACWAVADGALI